MTGTTTKHFKDYNTNYQRIKRALNHYVTAQVITNEINRISKKGVKSLSYGYIVAFVSLLRPNDYDIFRTLRKNNANVHTMRKVFINRYITGVKI